MSLQNDSQIEYSCNLNPMSITGSQSDRPSMRNKTMSSNCNSALQQTSCYLNHYTSAFKRIQTMFNDAKLCDVKLICNDNKMEIKAHRVILSSVSDYFSAMFTNNLSESFKTDIEMNDIDGNALKALIDYIYTGKIDLNDLNVFKILQVANFLQLDSVVKQGCDFLSNNLKITNCVSIYRFGEEQSLSQLKSISYKYLIENFEKLATNRELLNELNEHELAELFDDEYLNVSSEESVYETLFKWIDMNRDERIGSIGCLLSKVKLPLLKSKYLTKEIESNASLSTNCECQSLMLEAALYHLVPDRFITSPTSRTNPRKSTVKSTETITCIEICVVEEFVFNFFRLAICCVLEE